MDLDIPFDILLVLGRHINDSEIGVAVMDSGCFFQFHNRAFANMIGLETHSLVGLAYEKMLEKVHDLNSDDSLNWPSLSIWLNELRGDQHALTLRSFEVQVADGRWILASQQAHDNGMIVMICTDVTQNKQTELALQSAHDVLERLAMTDELTGLPNRRHFFSALEKEYARIVRHGHVACLAILDLDFFKRVNDKHGHAAGDEVLKHFAGMLRDHLRNEDIMGRIGGEEFAVLMPETNQDGARAMLERMRIELSRATLDFIEPGFGYAFSAGIAESRTKAWSCKDWLNAADSALYQAKADGRNRIALYLDRV